jgi:tRNA threonylcarbamoyladenosine biosynthesis protein TsaB
MALILNIDTATEIAIVSISDNDKVLDAAINRNQKDHASFLQPSIKQILKNTEIIFNQLDAVSVAAGPGSYTGLRVGMSSAKGFCFALNIPLIAINSLEIIALSSIKKEKNTEALYCPMIDARRMEVFTAVYDNRLKPIVEPCSMILDKESFQNLFKLNIIYFAGSGALKFKQLVQNKNILFDEMPASPGAMAQLSNESYKSNKFENIFTASPLYLKEFYTLYSVEQKNP